MKVKVSITLDVDRKGWEREYYLVGAEDVREDVKAAATLAVDEYLRSINLGRVISNG